jgi:hypothetical protein
MLWLIMRRPALAAVKCTKLGRPRRLAEAPVNRIGPPTAWKEPAGGGLAGEEAGKAAHAPEFFELIRRQIEEVDRLVVAGVEHHDGGRLDVVARGEGPVEQALDVLGRRGVHDDGFGHAPVGGDRIRHAPDIHFGPSAEEDMEAPRRKPAGDGSA